MRSSHAAREGKTFSWLDHPVPGEDFNCRCWTTPFTGKKTIDQIYDPPIKPEYPEVLITSLAVGTRIILGRASINSGVEMTEQVMSTTGKPTQKEI